MLTPPPPPPPPPPLPHRKKPSPASREEAAVRLQRWYRCNARRRRFLTVVNRARRRRRYFDERRRLAQRIYTGEVEAEEIRARLTVPGGHELVGTWMHERTVKAATKVQNLWRSIRARKKLLKLVAEQRQEQASRRIQTVFRQHRKRNQQSLLVKSAQENPCWRPLDTERLMRHEQEIISKRRQYHSSMCKSLSEAELRAQAESQYQGFETGLPRWRYDVWRTLFQREQTRQIIQALEGSNWDKPIPYGLCNASLLRDAEEKHRSRKNAFAQVPRARGSFDEVFDDIGTGASFVVESAAEEAEADMLLHSLESELGYDFSGEKSIT